MAACGQLAWEWTQLKAKKPGGGRPGPGGTLSCGLRRDLNDSCTDREPGFLSLTLVDCVMALAEEQSAIYELLTTEMKELPWRAGQHGRCRRGLDSENIITFSLML